MGRKLDRIEVDGVAVDGVKARFSNRFDIHEDDIKDLAFDEEGLMLVAYHVGSPSSSQSKKSGEVFRINVLNVKEARVIHNQALVRDIMERMDFEEPLQESLFDGSTETTVRPPVTQEDEPTKTFVFRDEETGDFMASINSDGKVVIGEEEEEYEDEEYVPPAPTLDPPAAPVPRPRHAVDTARGQAENDSALANFLYNTPARR